MKFPLWAAGGCLVFSLTATVISSLIPVWEAVLLNGAMAGYWVHYIRREY